MAKLTSLPLELISEISYWAVRMDTQNMAEHAAALVSETDQRDFFGARNPDFMGDRGDVLVDGLSQTDARRAMRGLNHHVPRDAAGLPGGPGGGAVTIGPAGDDDVDVDEPGNGGGAGPAGRANQGQRGAPRGGRPGNNPGNANGNANGNGNANANGAGRGNEPGGGNGPRAGAGPGAGLNANEGGGGGANDLPGPRPDDIQAMEAVFGPLAPLVALMTGMPPNDAGGRPPNADGANGAPAPVENRGNGGGRGNAPARASNGTSNPPTPVSSDATAGIQGLGGGLPPLDQVFSAQFNAHLNNPDIRRNNRHRHRHHGLYPDDFDEDEEADEDDDYYNGVTGPDLFRGMFGPGERGGRDAEDDDDMPDLIPARPANPGNPTLPANRVNPSTSRSRAARVEDEDEDMSPSFVRSSSAPTPTRNARINDDDEMPALVPVSSLGGGPSNFLRFGSRNAPQRDEDEEMPPLIPARRSAVTSPPASTSVPTPTSRVDKGKGVERPSTRVNPDDDDEMPPLIPVSRSASEPSAAKKPRRAVEDDEMPDLIPASSVRNRPSTSAAGPSAPRKNQPAAAKVTSPPLYSFGANKPLTTAPEIAPRSSSASASEGVQAPSMPFTFSSPISKGEPSGSEASGNSMATEVSVGTKGKGKEKEKESDTNTTGAVPPKPSTSLFSESGFASGFLNKGSSSKPSNGAPSNGIGGFAPGFLNRKPDTAAKTDDVNSSKSSMIATSVASKGNETTSGSSLKPTAPPEVSTSKSSSNTLPKVEPPVVGKPKFRDEDWEEYDSDLDEDYEDDEDDEDDEDYDDDEEDLYDSDEDDILFDDFLYNDGLPVNFIIPLALVSRTFLHASRRLLYRDIKLVDMYQASLLRQTLENRELDAAALDPPQDAEGAAKAVVRKGGNLASLVRTLRVTIPDDISNGRGGASNIFKIMELCTDLTDLDLECGFLGSSKDLYWRLLRNLKKLKKFVARSGTDAVRPLNITTLEFIRCMAIWKDLKHVDIHKLVDGSFEPVGCGKPDCGACSSDITRPSCALAHLSLSAPDISDSTLGVMLCNSKKSLKTFRLLHPSPLMARSGLLRALQSVGSCLTTLTVHVDGPAIYPFHPLHPIDYSGGESSKYFLDGAVKGLTQLKYLDIQGPLASHTLFSNLSPTLVGIVWGGCPAIQPNQVTKLLKRGTTSTRSASSNTLAGASSASQSARESSSGGKAPKSSKMVLPRLKTIAVMGDDMDWRDRDFSDFKSVCKTRNVKLTARSSYGRGFMAGPPGGIFMNMHVGPMPPPPN